MTEFNINLADFFFLLLFCKRYSIRLDCKYNAYATSGPDVDISISTRTLILEVCTSV